MKKQTKQRWKDEKSKTTAKLIQRHMFVYTILFEILIK